jgi:hypothetical protein
MLRQWRQRAEDVRHNGFYWCVGMPGCSLRGRTLLLVRWVAHGTVAMRREYILNGLNVDSLTVSADGSRATVDATLTEAAVLHDGGAGAADADAYESTYRARYELVRRTAPGAFGARAWRVVSGTVLY